MRHRISDFGMGFRMDCALGIVAVDVARSLAVRSERAEQAKLNPHPISALNGNFCPCDSRVIVSENIASCSSLRLNLYSNSEQ